MTITTERERLARLSGILGDATIELSMQIKREDVPGWASFCYVNFIVAVEAEFGVRFGIADTEAFADVGAIVNAIGAG